MSPPRLRRRILVLGLLLLGVVCSLYACVILVAPDLPGGHRFFAALYRASPSKGAVLDVYGALADSMEVERNRHDAYLVERVGLTESELELRAIVGFFRSQEWLSWAAGKAASATRGRLLGQLIGQLGAVEPRGAESDARLVNSVLLAEYLRRGGQLYKPMLWLWDSESPRRPIRQLSFGADFRRNVTPELGPEAREEMIGVLRTWWGDGSRWPRNENENPWEGSRLSVESQA